jgi:uncharacterized protein YuzB (UPF0349 family)
MIKITSYLCIAYSILIFILGFWSVSDAGDIVKGESQVSKNETFSVEFNKGLLSVDLRDENVTKVFKELEKKAKIEIINQDILLWGSLCQAPFFIKPNRDQLRL